MELKEFIRLAKINGYAGDGSEIYLPDGSKQFSFHAGDYRYIDRYSGNQDFEGSEKVWHDDSLVWRMNYHGSLNTIVSDDIFGFLKKALRQPDPDAPFRGPERFVEGDLVYQNMPKGSIDSFTGIETISHNSSEIYRLHYHGGSI